MYVAQLVPLPPQASQTEKVGLQRIYHIATNALSLESMLRLKEFGGPSPISLAAASRAACFRASAQSFPCWQQWAPQLRIAASKSGDLDMLARNYVSPSFWDSEAFTINLENAWLGFPEDPKWGPAGITLLQNARPPMPCTVQELPLQARAYKILHEAAGCSDLYQIICRRLCSWQICGASEQAPFQLNEVLPLISKMRVHEAMQIIKTWTNSWATSVRYHESTIFPCLLGCTDKDRYFGMIQVPPCPKAFGHLGSSPCDDFSHYLICPKMWRVIDSIVTHSVPIDPLKRLGLIDSNYENLFTLACCFHAYHAIKHVRNNHPSSLNFSANIRLFSEAFVTAAHIVGLQYTSVSMNAGG